MPTASCEKLLENQSEVNYGVELIHRRTGNSRGIFGPGDRDNPANFDRWYSIGWLVARLIKQRQPVHGLAARQANYRRGP
jgi:hypothetical protein